MHFEHIPFVWVSMYLSNSYNSSQITFLKTYLKMKSTIIFMTKLSKEVFLIKFP